MNIKAEAIQIKAKSGDTGSISGYAATWTREPDSYGDVIVKGAFSECIRKINEEGKALPFLWSHDSSNINSYIGVITLLKEDNHGLFFKAVFDDTPEAQRARELAASGRVIKFSFAYDILDQASVRLDDGRLVNELRKLNIHEISLVLFPANPDTGVIEVNGDRLEGARAYALLSEAENLLTKNNF